MTATTTPAPDPVVSAAPLVAHGIVKRFGSVVAVDHVDFEMRAGVHALLGENGAGKSTLVKVLYGFHPADEGEIRLAGEKVSIRTPADGRRLGLGMVFQQFTLIPAFTVAENIALFLPDLPWVLHHQAIKERIAELSARYGLAVEPDRLVGTLSVTEQQRVEILRVLLAGARILIFDEPTSVLPAQEIDALFDVFRRLKADGYPIVFITHKLREVFAVADSVTIMRHGAEVGTFDIAEVTEDRLVELMFGEAPAKAHRRPSGVPARRAPPVLELRGLATGRSGRALADIDLTIAAGEIVGVVGISGNGQRELGDVIVGMVRPAAGSRLLFGEDASGWSVRRIRDAGVGFVPENAMGMEVIAGMTVEENIALGGLDRFSRHGGLSVDWGAVRSELAGSFAALGLHPPDPKVTVATLSGGNVQRFAVARELARRPRLLVALYPTKGLDVATTAAVQRLLVAASDQGAGVLVVSQDLAELTALADRLIVLREGRIVATLIPGEADAYEIGRLMTGGD